MLALPLTWFESPWTGHRDPAVLDGADPREGEGVLHAGDEAVQLPGALLVEGEAALREEDPELAPGGHVGLAVCQAGRAPPPLLAHLQGQLLLLQHPLPVVLCHVGAEAPRGRGHSEAHFGRVPLVVLEELPSVPTTRNLENTQQPLLYKT